MIRNINSLRSAREGRQRGSGQQRPAQPLFLFLARSRYLKQSENFSNFCSFRCFYTSCFYYSSGEKLLHRGGGELRTARSDSIVMEGARDCSRPVGACWLVKNAALTVSFSKYEERPRLFMHVWLYFRESMVFRTVSTL